MSSINDDEKNRNSAAIINFCGQKITFKSSEADPAIVDEIVKLVSAHLKNAELRSKGGVPHQVALLALLDLAEEYVMARHKIEGYQHKLVERCIKLVNLVDGELKESGS
ncbi:MAG: cell division protein ZapA [Bdellovibrionota bacterium]